MLERVPQVRQLPFPCTSFLIQYSPSSVSHCEMWCCHVCESVLILDWSAKGGDRVFLQATWHCSPEDQYQHLHCHEYHKSPAWNWSQSHADYRGGTIVLWNSESVTSFIMQSLLWKAISCSVGEAVSCILWDLKLHYSVHKFPHGVEFK
jgi:hypothetical protein